MGVSERVLREVSEHRGAPSGVSPGKRVLVVTFDFPPNRTSAVYRMVGLTRYLPQLGWQPTVLTIAGGDFAQEPGLLEKLPPGVEVVRTKLLRVDRWERGTADAIRSVGGLQQPEAGKRVPRRTDRLLRSLGNFLRSTVYFPDQTVGWIPYALSKAIRLHRRQKFDLVYTTTPPRSAPIIGLLLKSLLGVPLVTEFMDPWYPPSRPIRRWAEDRVQALLARRSDRVVVMLQQHGEDLRRQYALSAGKVAVVRNGFFEEDFASMERVEPKHLDPAYIHVSHFGTIYPGNQGKFFVALRQLVEEHPELKNKIRLHLIGFPCEEVVGYTKEEQLKDMIEVHGFLPRREDTLEMMLASDCLLLFWGRPDFSRLAIAGKTYDYLRSGRPVLAVSGSGGGVAELIEQGEAGWVAPPDDVGGIKKVLIRAFNTLQKQRHKGVPRPEYVAQFRWEQLAGQLASTFEEAQRHDS
jgi:glycosyltransferase involved in cell wall biosynthesis